jgi:hypothetical protein
MASFASPGLREHRLALAKATVGPGLDALAEQFSADVEARNPTFFLSHDRDDYITELRAELAHLLRKAAS